MMQSRQRAGRFCLPTWPFPRAMVSIKAKIRDHSPRGYADRELRNVVGELNAVLWGWDASFRSVHGNSSRKFATIDHYVNTDGEARQRQARTLGPQLDHLFTYRWLTTSGATGWQARCATGPRMSDIERCRRAVFHHRHLRRSSSLVLMTRELQPMRRGVTTSPMIVRDTGERAFVPRARSPDPREVSSAALRRSGSGCSLRSRGHSPPRRSTPL